MGLQLIPRYAQSGNPNETDVIISSYEALSPDSLSGRLTRFTRSGAQLEDVVYLNATSYSFTTLQPLSNKSDALYIGAWHSPFVVDEGAVDYFTWRTIFEENIDVYSESPAALLFLTFIDFILTFG